MESPFRKQLRKDVRKRAKQLKCLTEDAIIETLAEEYVLPKKTIRKYLQP